MRSYKFQTLDHELIKRSYLEEQKSMKTIATELGVSPVLIRKSLVSSGVQIRSRGEAQRLRRDKRGMQHDMELKAEITRLYLEEKLSANACAKQVGIAHQTVGYLLDLWGIPKRNDLHKTCKSDELPDDEIVSLYVDKEMSAPKIASRYDVSAPTIYKVIRKNGVEIRTLSEAIALAHKQRTEKAARKNAVLAISGENVNPVAQQGNEQQADFSILTTSDSVNGNAEKPDNISEEEILVQRKKRWRQDVVVRKNMSIQEMRDADLTIDEIAEIKGQSRVSVFQALQNSGI